MSYVADLRGKVALVTGASSGLGRHFARLLAQCGARTVVAGRRRGSLDALVHEIECAGGEAQAVTLDVTNLAAVPKIIQTIGPIDVLVNNAGVANTASILERTVADWNETIGTNLTGTFFVALEVARRMRSRQSSGSIINIASILRVRQGGQVTPYAISKAGLIQMTKQLALELARFEIRVNALVPGYIETDLNREFFASAAGQALIGRVPQRRLGRYEDLDGPLLLLCSDASKFMTGSVIAVDGGHLVSSL
jgi:NAD(P)-dependent dehydrogenase (short-subunit alcohol dehydrogenase family)